MTIGHQLPFVRASAGHGVLHVSHSQQGSAIVDERLPALFPEVNNAICCVLL